MSIELKVSTIEGGLGQLLGSKSAYLLKQNVDLLSQTRSCSHYLFATSGAFFAVTMKSEVLEYFDCDFGSP